jgi:hypothetical protein
MKQENEYNSRAASALNSWDGAVRAAAPAQLYAKTMARLERRRNSGWNNIAAFFARPAVAFATILLVLALNAWIVYYFSGNNDNTEQTVATLISEYDLDNDLSFVDNNENR